MAAESERSVDLSGAFEWRCIGPHRGGRVVAVAGDPEERATFYFGACAGGVWKTTDGGAYWENVSDGFFRTAAVGALEVSTSDPSVIYAGMGETCIRSNVSHGDGVYRSTDGGRTWKHLGLERTRHVAKVRVHPHDPDLVYVAALGHAWGPNSERGVYRSRDGGRTWELVLHRNDRTGAIDLSMDPHNPRVLYATLWEAQRTPYSLSSGGPGSSLFRSTDGGDIWEELTDRPGLPKGLVGKIGVAVSPAKPGRVWAIVEAEDGAVFRSDDWGETWERLSEDGELRRRAWYYMHIYADPQDPETVWVLNVQCWKSLDGGRTFAAVPTPHGDNHDLWIDPRDPKRMIEGNDGGACVTFNGGATWSTIYNQPTAQFYHVTTDTRVPYRVYGSQQDNTAISVPSRSPLGVITATEWYVPGGGESGYIAVRPDDPDVVFGGAIGSGAGNGRLLRYDHGVRQERNVTAWPEATGMGDGAADLRYRFQWTFPILISRHDPRVLYVAANVLLRSTDDGGRWEVISPDLTCNDPEKLQPSGGPITRDNSGAEVYCTIFALAESPHEQGVLWAGTDDGLVHISRDGGRSWENITPADLPEWALISIIEPSPHDPAAAYLAATRYKHDDLAPYLYRTNDYGRSWRRITEGIPETDFTRVIRCDPDVPGLLYAGTETGVYVSLDDGESWRPLQGNLPVAPIYDLCVRGSDLVAATHGRSFWVLDDLSTVRQVARGEVDRARPTLFAPRTTVRFRVYEGYGSKPGAGVLYSMAGPLGFAYRQRTTPDERTVKQPLDAGQNPPNGVILTYYLPSEPEGDISLAFSDQQGNELRRFTSKRDEEKQDETEKPLEGPEAETQRAPKQAGMNRFVWDMRCSPAHRVPGDKSTEDALAGPLVPPGRYQVRLEVEGQTLAQELEIVKDPNVATSQEEIEEQFRLLLAVRDKLSETHDAINEIRDLKGQLDGWERRAGKESSWGGVAERARALREHLEEVEGELIQPRADSPLAFPTKLNSRLANLAGFVGEGDYPPTRQAREVFASLSERIDTQLRRLGEIREGELAAFNETVRERGMPAIS